jgi:hypothetical protein
MLIKGSRRDIKDANGRKSIDMINEYVDPEKRNELVSILGKQPFSIPCS